ncbi:hypothetical protein niasHT_008590 [Heterodera trifolii]|uniref:Uncharacterized protein n=1 Tax=Heterodera trifolii TaxID=157864 RepID=A0ABD2M3A8_9BILA
MCCDSSYNKWMCWFGFHVTNGSLVAAWIFLLAGIFAFLSVLQMLVSRHIYIEYIFNLITPILLLCGSVPIIVGEMRGQRTSKMYRPFLIATAISFAITAFPELVGKVLRLIQNGFDAYYFLGLWPYTLALIVIWLYPIVYRAYKFVQQNEEQKIGGPYEQNAKVVNQQYAKVVPMPMP